MDVREKLVELLNEVQETGVNEIPAGFGFTREYIANEKVASHLTAHGVTVQEDCKECAEATQNCIVKLQEQIAELRSAQEWVSVEDRLPDPKENAICINRYGAMMIGIYTEWGWTFPCYFEEPTHWMLMPQPPKGE